MFPKTRSPLCLHLPAVLLLFLLLTACTGRQPEPTPTPPATTTHSTATPQPIPTSTSTRPSSPTPKPTTSPTPLATSTPIPDPPSPTPAPGPAEGVTYHLVEWTPGHASHLNALLQAYPDTTDLETSPFWGNGEYWELFRLPALVKLEAARRFPAAENVTDWQWTAAYDLGRADGSQYVDHYYALLISTALNEGVTPITELPTWWQQHEPRLTLTLTELQPFPGNRTNHLLFLDGLGGAYFWLVESDGGYQLYPFLSALAFYEPRPSTIQFDLGDINGDGYPEAITNEEPLFEDGRGGYSTLRVFDLTQLPPQTIPFTPAAPREFLTGWAANELNTGLQISRLVEFMACPVPLVETYRWDGQSLLLDTTSYPTEEEVAAANALDQYGNPPIQLENCIPYLSDWLKTIAWGDVGAIETLEARLPGWLETEIPLLSNEPNSPDFGDELRFRLALAHAFNGNTQSAVHYMNAIVATPVISTSQWITATEHFLAAYQPEGSLTQACTAVPICSPFMPIERLAGLISAGSATPMDTLQSFGLPIEATGSFDFEHDQQPEQWFLTHDQDNRNLELWLLAQTTGQIQPLRVGNISDAQNATLIELPPIQGKSIFKFVTAADHLFFTIERAPNGRLLATTHHTYALPAYHAALHSFILGQPAEQIRDTLLSYQQLPYQDCSEYRNLCPDLLYLLALTYELSNDQTNAIATYLHLWRTYPDSPYILIIQTKLQPQPTPATP